MSEPDLCATLSEMSYRDNGVPLPGVPISLVANKELASKRIGNPPFEERILWMEHILEIGCTGPFYDFKEVVNEIFGFCFYFIDVHIINTDERRTLVLEGNFTLDEIFAFLKIQYNKMGHNARIFVPSRWVKDIRLKNSKGSQKSYLLWTFPKNYNMNSLIEVMADTFEWLKPISDLSCEQFESLEISFETKPGTDEFPIPEERNLTIGSAVVAQDCYGKWYHGQIFRVSTGGELLQMQAKDDRFVGIQGRIFKGEIRKAVRKYGVDITAYLVHFIGFKQSWNEWMLHKDQSVNESISHGNMLLSIPELPYSEDLNPRHYERKWYPTKKDTESFCKHVS